MEAVAIMPESYKPDHTCSRGRLRPLPLGLRGQDLVLLEKVLWLGKCTLNYFVIFAQFLYIFMILGVPIQDAQLTSSLEVTPRSEKGHVTRSHEGPTSVLTRTDCPNLSNIEARTLSCLTLKIPTRHPAEPLRLCLIGNGGKACPQGPQSRA